MAKIFQNRFLKPSKAVGFYIFYIGLILLLKIIFNEKISIFYAFAIFLLLPCFDCIIWGFTDKKYKVLVIPGVATLLTLIFLLLYEFILNKYMPIEKFWPVFGLFPATAFIIYSFVFPRKNPRIIIPAIFIAFISIIMLLFSLNIIKIEFKAFLLFFISISIMSLGIYIIYNNNIINKMRTKEANNQGNNKIDKG